MSETGTFDELVAATIRVAVDEWRVHNDPVAVHGVSMPEYIRQALVDAGLLSSDEDTLLELRRRSDDCKRTTEALLPLLREHPLSRDDVQGDNLRVGYLAETAAEVIRWQAVELDRLRCRESMGLKEIAELLARRADDEGRVEHHQALHSLADEVLAVHREQGGDRG